MVRTAECKTALIFFTRSAAIAASQFYLDSNSHVLTINTSAQPDNVTVAREPAVKLAAIGIRRCCTHLAFDANDGVWRRAFNLQSGSMEYKAPINNAGMKEITQVNATRNGDIGSEFAADTVVKSFITTTPRTGLQTTK